MIRAYNVLTCDFITKEQISYIILGYKEDDLGFFPDNKTEISEISPNLWQTIILDNKLNLYQFCLGRVELKNKTWEIVDKKVLPCSIILLEIKQKINNFVTDLIDSRTLARELEELFKQELKRLADELLKEQEEVITKLNRHHSISVRAVKNVFKEIGVVIDNKC